VAPRVSGPSISVTCMPGMANDRNPEVTRISRGDVALVLATPDKESLSATRDEVLVLVHNRLGWCSAAGLVEL